MSGIINIKTNDRFRRKANPINNFLLVRGGFPSQSTRKRNPSIVDNPTVSFCPTVFTVATWTMPIGKNRGVESCQMCL